MKYALFVRLEAKPGKEQDIAQFLQAGLGMAQQETATPVWFALQLGPSTFGVFDAFSTKRAARRTSTARSPRRSAQRLRAAGAAALDRTYRRTRRRSCRSRPFPVKSVI